MIDLACNWALIKQYFPAGTWEIAYGLSLRESSGDSRAVRDTRGRTDLPSGYSQEWSIGLFQINVLAHTSVTADQMFDPEQNVRYAAGLYASRGGWEDWRRADTWEVPPAGMTPQAGPEGGCSGGTGGGGGIGGVSSKMLLVLLVIGAILLDELD